MQKILMSAAILLAYAAPAALAQQPEAISLLGDPLHPRDFPAETRTRLEADLSSARAAYDASPDDADAIIWLGRRLGYLERYRDAVDVFSEGIAKHPGDARMYRHRGHRYITLRRFDDAIADFERAARLIHSQPDEVEPDGAPNRFNIPTSTLQSNIWYHLGLAYYLNADWGNALHAYREAMKVSKNNDMLVATSDWLYMTLRRMGRDEEGADDLTLATQGYGVGNWYLYNGEGDRAREIFRQVVAGPYWAAFGHIAAEAELAR
jgi:tetratricopeptide (TPR) repeat protein